MSLYTLYGFDAEFSPADEWDEVTPAMDQLGEDHGSCAVPGQVPDEEGLNKAVADAFGPVALPVRRTWSDEGANLPLAPIEASCYFCAKVRLCLKTAGSQYMCADCHTTIVPR